MRVRVGAGVKVKVRVEVEVRLRLRLRALIMRAEVRACEGHVMLCYGQTVDYSRSRHITRFKTTKVIWGDRAAATWHVPNVGDPKATRAHAHTPPYPYPYSCLYAYHYRYRIPTYLHIYQP